MINTDEFSQKISALSSVKKVYVKRLWSPARIIIYVEEKANPHSVILIGHNESTYFGKITSNTQGIINQPATTNGIHINGVKTETLLR